MEATQKSPLELRSISQILDYQFFIPHYQRGYRWTKQQVEDLLNDIDGFTPKQIAGKPEDKTFYCLQPIVLKRCKEDTIAENDLAGDWYEVIDGQQRLTTFYLILHYANEMWTGARKKPEITIHYETREHCVPILKEIKTVENGSAVAINRENIDFYHITTAYNTINQWVINYSKVNKRPFDEDAFKSKFNSSSKIIWYEVGEKENGKLLFERLNMGKIPLTNAELIKALFLSTASFPRLVRDEQLIKQFEIARLWDEIEQKLNEKDGKFWSFLTNKSRASYPTKIELLLDMVAEKRPYEQDPLATFIYFNQKQKSEKDGLLSLWNQVEQTYLTVCEWYRDKEYYHKIGYLITVDVSTNIAELVNKSNTLGKENFKAYLNSKLREAVNYEISELQYGEDNDRLQKILILFNVQTILQSDGVTDFYPFKQHKSNQWSLEHIHAQNAEGVGNTQDAWLAWLNVHAELLEDLLNSGSTMVESAVLKSALEKIKEYANPELTRERFREIYESVNRIFSVDTEREDGDRDGIGNLALLSQPDNAALNNAVFEVKRRMIMDLDKAGRYIPICTRRAFMKYYTANQSSIHFHFWTKEDRKAYQAEIEACLRDYLLQNNGVNHENK